MVKSGRSQTIATTQSFPDIPQNNCENKKNPIPSNLVKVTPILNGDRIPLYLPTMRRFDFDSHPETCLPPPPNYRRFVSFSRKKKKRERDSTDPNPRREGGAKKETVHREMERVIRIYVPYVGTLGNLHIDLPRKCVIHGSRTSQKQKLIRAIVILVSPFESRRRTTRAEERDENARRRLLETGR